jgi:hypothetical protein
VDFVDSEVYCAGSINKKLVLKSSIKGLAGEAVKFCGIAYELYTFEK